MHMRPKFLMAGLISALFGGVAPQSVARSQKQRLRREPTTTRQYIAASGFRPHQSNRECARRMGGTVWKEFKAMTRLRRGLPA